MEKRLMNVLTWMLLAGLVLNGGAVLWANIEGNLTAVVTFCTMLIICVQLCIYIDSLGEVK
jgi:hypothetical protein